MSSIPPNPENSNPEGAQPQPQMVTVSAPNVRPIVTYTLLAITVGIFILQYFTKAVWGVDIPSALGVKSNELIVGGQYWRLFTPMFLHSSSFLMHILFNMYALYSFGPTLERFYGHWGFLGLYLIAGFCGNVLSFMLSPAPSLGASTAIFGLLGAEAVFLYHNRQVLGNRAQRALINLITIAGLNLVLGFASGFVDNWGHIGGLLGGTTFAWFGGPLLEVKGIPPYLTLENVRNHKSVLLAGVGVTLVFLALAIYTVIVRS